MWNPALGYAYYGMDAVHKACQVGKKAVLCSKINILLY